MSSIKVLIKTCPELNTSRVPFFMIYVQTMSVIHGEPLWCAKAYHRHLGLCLSQVSNLYLSFVLPVQLVVEYLIWMHLNLLFHCSMLNWQEIERHDFCGIRAMFCFCRSQHSRASYLVILGLFLEKQVIPRFA